jgi:predicted Zn-dependent protease
MAGGSRFLARSRDEELLADDLGLRYLKQANYDPLALAGVLDTLATLHGGPGREQPHTHPTTVHRRARIHLATGRDPKPAYDAGYVETLDGLLFGPDPRDGYFKDDHFVHPQLGFALALPKNWTVEYREGRALAKNPESNTYLVVSESRSESVRGGMNEIFSGDVAKKEPWSGTLGTGAAAMAEFSTIYDGRELHAFIGLVEFEGKIIQVVAFSPVAQWPAQETRGVFKSFSAATTAQRDVQPMKVELVELDTPMTLEHFYETHPSSVPLGVIARINRVKHPEATLPAGHRLKRVRGFNPDFASIQR